MDSHFTWKSRIPTSLEVALEVVDSHFAGAQFRTEVRTLERERDLRFGVSENEPLVRYLYRSGGVFSSAKFNRPTALSVFRQRLANGRICSRGHPFAGDPNLSAGGLDQLT